ncbi:MAG TPA: type II toxin-antitoxin system VapC family toxin [bacterium]|nr:type II toxin-antitoxin system VapC family toxin [bacterium]
MNRFVVDASVVAKWIFPEEHAKESSCLVREQTSLHAPDFLSIELHNILSKKVRKKDIPPESESNILRQMEFLPVQFHLSSELLRGAYDLSVRFHTSLYDCLYLSLALHLDCPLVTADARFQKSFQKTLLGATVIHVLDVQHESPS